MNDEDGFNCRCPDCQREYYSYLVDDINESDSLMERQCINCAARENDFESRQTYGDWE